MIEFLTTLVSTPLGIACLIVGIIAVVVIVLLFIKHGYSLGKDESGHYSLKKKEKIVKEKKINTSMIMSDITDIIDHTEEKMKDIREETRLEIRRIQRNALDSAINNMCLEFSNQIINTEKIDQIVETLELYLQRDFMRILSEKLDELRHSPNFLNRSDQDISQEVQNITEDCIGKMKLKIRSYILIGDQKSLITLFDNSKRTIVNTLDATIKNFLKLSKEEQEKLLEWAKIRTTKINEKIKSMCEE